MGNESSKSPYKSVVKGRRLLLTFLADRLYISHHTILVDTIGPMYALSYSDLIDVSMIHGNQKAPGNGMGGVFIVI